MDRDGATTDGGSPEDDRTIREYCTTRDPALRSHILEQYEGLAAAVARSFCGRGERRDDVLQVARLGLLRALERFDPDRGVRFTTYAWRVASGDLKRHFRDHCWDLHVPRRIKEASVAVAAARDRAQHVLGRPPTIEEISEHTGIDEEHVLEAMDARNAFAAGSLEAAPFEGGLRPHERPHPTPDGDDLSRCEARVMVEQLLPRLPPIEQEMIRLRYYEELPQAVIGRRLGCSQVTVSRRLSSALAQMRSWAAAA